MHSLRFAFDGIRHFFRRERNGRIQGVVAVAVVLTALLLGVSRAEWIALLLCIAFVISLEMLNSAIERICNLYTPEIHPAIKIIKDVAAAAVLWAAFVSIIIGLLIFIPHLLALLTKTGAATYTSAG